jgi:cytidylate kinase
LISPEKDRIAYICQVERLSYAEAEQMVRQRDRARRRYMIREFGRSPRQLVHFDLVLNAAELGVEGCAGVISAAAREKDAYLRTRRR